MCIAVPDTRYLGEKNGELPGWRSGYGGELGDKGVSGGAGKIFEGADERRTTYVAQNVTHHVIGMS